MTTIALLHLDPRPGKIENNLSAIESATLTAADCGASVVVTPELAVSGYGFFDLIGGDWIHRDGATLRAWATDLAKKAGVQLVLGTPDHDPTTGCRHNAMWVIGSNGELVGSHHKINCLGIGAEAFATPGKSATVVTLSGIGQVGLLVCADLYSPRLVTATKQAGAALFVSSANWAPGENGPEGVWERASLEAPLLVCNRTGHDVVEFRAAETVVAAGGRRLASFSSSTPMIVLVDWLPTLRTLTSWRNVSPTG